MVDDVRSGVGSEHSHFGIHASSVSGAVVNEEAINVHFIQTLLILKFVHKIIEDLLIRNKLRLNHK